MVSRRSVEFEKAASRRQGAHCRRILKLAEELFAATYTFQGDKFRLCDKDEIKALIGRSPDKADALALTFAFPVAPRPHYLMGKQEDPIRKARVETAPIVGCGVCRGSRVPLY